ncbi:MAG: GNAT family N-acetyltransferase [Candidatus Fimousia sp.]
MQIREIDTSETNKLLECIIQLSEHHNQVSVNFKGSFPSRPYEETIRIFSEGLQDKNSYIAVIEDADKIVGFCKVDLISKNGKLDYLVVLQEYRGKGLGNQLMDWAMNTFRKHHIKHIEVKVVDGNDAIHLYEKYGFKMQSHILCFRED